MAMRAATYAEIKQQFGDNVELLRHELAISVRCLEKVLRAIDRPDVPKDALMKAQEALNEAGSKSILEFGDGETEAIS